MFIHEKLIQCTAVRIIKRLKSRAFALFIYLLFLFKSKFAFPRKRDNVMYLLYLSLLCTSVSASSLPSLEYAVSTNNNSLGSVLGRPSPGPVCGGLWSIGGLDWKFGHMPYGRIRTILRSRRISKLKYKSERVAY